MMNTFTNEQGIVIVHNLIQAIQDNKQYLSDIDGLIGDGDHGVNMNKGFTLCAAELEKNPGNLSHGMSVLSKILMLKIGGSMGPLYGKFFQAIAKTTAEKEEITQYDFAIIMEAIVANIESISDAKVGDKTLMDTLVPAKNAFINATKSGKLFEDALTDLTIAAKAGSESTRDMVSKLGRSARLGERSRGVLDAGSVSCCLILTTMAETVKGMLVEPLTPKGELEKIRIE
jgi:phosphoenolpyruvate---glycerone phosphotransferase subunit DhaL